jgi:hypothetical protein
MGVPLFSSCTNIFNLFAGPPTFIYPFLTGFHAFLPCNGLTMAGSKIICTYLFKIYFLSFSPKLNIQSPLLLSIFPCHIKICIYENSESPSDCYLLNILARRTFIKGYGNVGLEKNT